MDNIYGLNYEQIQAFALQQGWKAFRGKQIFRWLYRDRVSNFEAMSNLSKETREVLQSTFQMQTLNLVRKQEAKDGTTKYLFSLADGSLVETVLMHFNYGKSVCVSTQVGCNMGCQFCASGLLKKQRDLAVHEMVEQVMYIQHELDKKADRVSHIVVMGSGEPFDNYEAMMQFLSIVNEDNGLAIGARHITISTCGIVPKIREFSKGKYQYNLAISLHAPNDTLRSQLMPINQAYPLDELIDCLKEYGELNNRRLTFEYILLKGVNDQEEHARQLAKRLHGLHYYMNLIPYNAVDEHGYQGVDHEAAMHFYDLLTKLGVRCTIRKEHGSDIDAACGQLRAKEIRGEHT